MKSRSLSRLWQRVSRAGTPSRSAQTPRAPAEPPLYPMHPETRQRLAALRWERILVGQRPNPERPLSTYLRGRSFGARWTARE